jgi:hypothetical protein
MISTIPKLGANFGLESGLQPEARASKVRLWSLKADY